MNSARMEVDEVPYVDTGVPAGFPSPATDYVEERINLNNFLIRNPSSTFVFKCTGLSMVDAFMPPLCRIVVDRSIKPKNGDIVLAYYNGGFTVKYLQVNEHKCKLIAANRKWPEIEIHNPSDLVIWGVVTAIISLPKDFKYDCFG